MGDFLCLFFRCPFDGATAGLAGADGASNMVGFAAAWAFDDVWCGLVGLVFGWVIVGKCGLAGAFWLILAHRTGHTSHSKRARDGCGDFSEYETNHKHNEAENGYPAAKIGELLVERVKAEVDEELKEWNVDAEILLKEFVAARSETEQGDDENSGRYAVIAVAAIDEEASDCE